MQPPKEPVERSMYQEQRFQVLTKSHPELAKSLLQRAQAEVDARWLMYQNLAVWSGGF
jgi:pyruvate-ferredoxin/flavodoxin oxidoreductase